jgi:hypothetical protein
LFSNWVLDAKDPSGSIKAQQGGLTPPGGADFDVTTVALPPNATAKTVLMKELAGASILELQEKPIGTFLVGSTHTLGPSGVRVRYRDTYGPQVTLDNITVYVAACRQLHKFFFTYHKDDPKEKQYIKWFDNVIDTIEFKC